ncbi:hypothetical protein JTB14_000922 [Gonioctena quinquepunctata]|nr:hypothetical protein JTB14_000922 [Gonioctena quinquepunctata]
MSSMSNTAVPPSFEKLEGSTNYMDWKYTREIHLINCDLWEYVESTGQDENQKKLDDKNNKRALAAIISGVKTHIHTEIRKLKSGKEVWDRLRNIFESKGFSRVAALIEQLVLIRYSECSGMDEYLNKKTKIAQQLKAIDTEIKSGVLAALIFVSIPDYFKPLIMALENCGLELTTDLVKERLLAEAAKKKGKNCINIEQTG